MGKRLEEKGKIGVQESGLLGSPPKSAPTPPPPVWSNFIYLSESFSRELLNCPLGSQESKEDKPHKTIIEITEMVS